MPRQYFRNVRAVIGLGANEIPLEQDENGASLRFRFEVVKNQITSRLHNSLKLEIFNLSSSTREKIKERGVQVRLDVGYGDVPVKIFEGQIRRAFSVHEETEWITTIYANEQWRAMSNATITQTWKEGTDAEVILRHLAEQFAEQFEEVTSGFVLQDLGNLPKLLNSLSLTGSLAVALDEAVEKYGLQSWGWVDGRIEISGPIPNFNEEVFVVSAGTGMIGSPIVTDLGVKVVTLLNPSLRVNRNIRIESVGAGLKIGGIEIRQRVPQLQEGEYQMGEIVSNGDNYGNQWTSSIQTRVIPGTV